MSQPDQTQRDEPAAPPCPICGKPAVPACRPFCSGRCADVDLQRWLSGRYAIPTGEEGPGDEDRET
ncbi:MAG: DNA gyrase inhibitor YacG [Methylobacterium frigidaeris]